MNAIQIILRCMPWQPQEEVSLPVDLPTRSSAHLQRYLLPLKIPAYWNLPMTWRLYEGRPYSDQFNLLYVSDQALLDMLITNARQWLEKAVLLCSDRQPGWPAEPGELLPARGTGVSASFQSSITNLLGRAVPSITPAEPEGIQVYEPEQPGCLL